MLIHAQSVLQMDILLSIINRRLDCVSRQEAGPFYTACMTTEPLLQSFEAHSLAVVPYEGRICEALQGVLMELARLRVHGVSEVRPSGRILHTVTSMPNDSVAGIPEGIADIVL
jgi:hypothetical protein